MALVTRRCLDDIRLRANIVELAGDYTALKKMGAKWRGLSPFQTEKSPSFYVDESKGLFYCFSTNQGGDIFKLVMLKEGLTFGEAIERVGARFGIPLEYEKGADGKSGADERSLRGKLLELHEVVTEHFHACFKANNELAGRVREYWTGKRKFTMAVADEFRIGFAPPDGGGLMAVLLKKGFDKPVLAACGLFVGTDYNPDPARWKPRFRGRLMVPIRDIQKRVVAFTARQLDGITPTDDPSHEAKYVNSPETDIFHKSRILFNLDRAMDAAKEKDAVVLVEGQLDAIRCYTSGVRNAVASQGTAIGDEHVRLIARYANRIDALLDADKAGRRAVLRLLPIALKGGLDIRCLSVPGGKDPDDYFAEAGAAGWAAVEATATDAVAYAVRALIPQGEPMAPAKKLEAVKEIFAVVTQAQSALLRESALATIARIAGLDRSAVLRDFEAFQIEERRLAGLRANTPGRPVSSDEPPFIEPDDAGTGESLPGGMPVEKESLSSKESGLLSLVLHHPELAAPLARVTRPEWISERDLSGRLLNRILAEAEHGEWHGVTSAEELAENEAERNQLFRILAENPPYGESPKKGANECLRVMHAEWISRRMAEIETRLLELGDTFDDTFVRLRTERMELRRQMKTPPEIG
jgi:DNA primase